MKRIIAILVSAGWAFVLLAASETNEVALPSPGGNLPVAATVPAVTNNVPEITETRIKSDRAEFDLKGRYVVYSGNVRAKDPQMDLSCEKLTVQISQTGGKLESIIAEGNVVVDFLDDKGQRIHGTGGRATYNYRVTANATNDVIELTEDPVLKTQQGTMEGDVITYDRANDNLRVTNSRMVIRPETSESPDAASGDSKSATNSPNSIPANHDGP